MLLKTLKDYKKVLESPANSSSAPVLLTNLLHPQDDQLKIGYSIALLLLQPEARTLHLEFESSSETIFILKGSARVIMKDKTVELSEGELLFLEAGTARTIHNCGKETLTYLSIAEPAFQAETCKVLEPAEIYPL